MPLLRRKSKHQDTVETNVNITALMDVLTVLLFFLIKSFTVSASALNPPKGIRLPASYSDISAEEAVVISITKDSLLANNDKLLGLRKGIFLEDDVGADGRTLIPLKVFLDRQHQKRLAVYKGAGDTSFLPPGKLLIQADKKLSFNVLKFVLHTSALTGYSDYQFVIDRNDND